MSHHTCRELPVFRLVVGWLIGFALGWVWLASRVVPNTPAIAKHSPLVPISAAAEESAGNPPPPERPTDAALPELSGAGAVALSAPAAPTSAEGQPARVKPPVESQAGETPPLTIISASPDNDPGIGAGNWFWDGADWQWNPGFLNGQFVEMPFEVLVPLPFDDDWRPSFGDGFAYSIGSAPDGLGWGFGALHSNFDPTPFCQRPGRLTHTGSPRQTPLNRWGMSRASSSGRASALANRASTPTAPMPTIISSAPQPNREPLASAPAERSSLREWPQPALSGASSRWRNTGLTIISAAPPVALPGALSHRNASGQQGRPAMPAPVWARANEAYPNHARPTTTGPTPTRFSAGPAPVSFGSASFGAVAAPPSAAMIHGGRR